MRQEAPPTSSTADVAGTLALGGLVSLAGKICGRGLALLTQIAVARVLGPAHFGLYALGWTVLKVGSLTGSLGLDKGVVRFATEARQRDLPGTLGRALVLASASGVLLGALLWNGAELLAGRLFAKPGLEPVLRWFALALPAAILLRVVAAATRISKRMGRGVLAEDLVQPGAQLALVAALYLLGYRLAGPPAAVTGSFLLAAALALVSLVRLYPSTLPLRTDSPVAWSKLVSFSLLSLAATAATFLILRVDRLVVGYFLSAEEVGVYEVAAQLAGLLPLIGGSFGAVFAPLVVESFRPGNAARLEEIYRVSTRWGLTLVLPAALWITFSTEDLLLVALGPHFLPAGQPLLLLTAGQLVNAATGPVGLLLVMAGRQKSWFGAAAVALPLHLVLSVGLVPRLGIAGAAAATAVSVTLLFGAGLVLVRRELGVWPYDRRSLMAPLAALVTAAGLGLLTQVDAGGPLLRLITRLGLTLAVYPPVLFLLLPVDPEDRRLFERLVRRLGRHGSRDGTPPTEPGDPRHATGRR